MANKYVWETIPSFNQSFFEGQIVVLNEMWPNYRYLKKEFGHLFPRAIQSINHGDGIVRFKLGVSNIAFASQVLSKV